MKAARSRVVWVLFLLFILLSSSGCTPVLKSEQASAEKTVKITPGITIGQTFTSDGRGLSGIDVLVGPTGGEATLSLTLYTDAQKHGVVAAASLPLKAGDAPTYQRFVFPALRGSANADYYFEIRVESGPGAVFAAASGERYLNGSLYQDQAAQDAQLAFRLAYDRWEYGAGLLKEFLGWGWFLILSGWLFLLPGWGILALCLGDAWDKRWWTEKLALAVGVGLALYIILFLWLNIVHLRLGPVMIWVLPLAAAGFLAWKNRSRLFQNARAGLLWPPEHRAEDFAFIAVLAMIFISRFWVIRGVDIPLWGDSYQHTMMAQLFAENQGLFSSWQPYVPYHGLTIQYGFSANAAAWMWLTGMDSARGVLVFGQLQNFFAILVIYPLAVQLSRRSRWAGIASLVIAGLISATPAIFVNWGRYAHLTGQTILPAAVCLVWYWLEEDRFSWKQAALHGLMLAGMLLAYYRMAFYYAAFFPLLIVHLRVHGPFKKDLARWKTGILKLAAVALVGLFFLIPWILNVGGSNLSDSVETAVIDGTPLQWVIDDYRSWLNYQLYIPRWMLGLLALSLLTSLTLKRWEVAGVVVRAGLVSAVKALMLLHVPGAIMMQSYAVLISMYLFTSLALAWLAGLVIEWALAHLRPAGMVLVLAAVLAVSLYGLNRQRKLLDPNTYAIVTRPDLRAMAWIRSQTQADAVFLVEGFRVFAGESAVGSDGGWWIPLLAGRGNTMPPQYALVNEQPDEPEYSERVVELVEHLETRSLADVEARKTLCEWGITHVYVGQKQGKASIQKTQLFPAILDVADGFFQLVYAQDRVRIYAVSPDACAGLAQK
jgi:hypothetical protein